MTRLDRPWLAGVALAVGFGAGLTAAPTEARADSADDRAISIVVHIPELPDGGPGTPPNLPGTGTDLPGHLAAWAALLISGGAALIVGSRRGRKTPVA